MKFFLIIPFLCFTLNTFGQTGKIKVSVYEKGDTTRVIPFAVIQLGSTATHDFLFDGMTDVNGYFVAKDLLPGKYDLKVHYEGYLDCILAGQVVEKGKCTCVKMELIPISKDSVRALLGVSGYNFMADTNWQTTSSSVSMKQIKNNEKLVKVIDFKYFQVKTPKDWKKLELHGIDSYVGGLTDGVDTLYFDFGRYSNDLTDEHEKQLYAADTINGKIGYVTKPKDKRKGILGVFFANIDGDRFNLCTHNWKDEGTIISIFQTIKFQTSDTTRNSQTLKFVSKEFK